MDMGGLTTKIKKGSRLRQFKLKWKIPKKKKKISLCGGPSCKHGIEGPEAFSVVEKPLCQILIKESLERRHDFLKNER